MSSLLLDPICWNWFLLGLALCGLEIMAPGTFLLWFGLSAAAVGLATALFPTLPYQVQLLAFAAFSLTFVVIGRRYMARWFAKHDDSGHLNQRLLQLIGNKVTLKEPIINGRGRITIAGSSWRVVGPDLPAGANVYVTGGEGTTLEVSSDAPTAEK